MIEFRIGDINAFSIQDIHGAITDRSCHSKRHGNAVVEMRVDHCTMERFAAVDDHAVLCALDISTHAGEIVNHNCDTVGFFDFEFLCIADDRGSLSKSSHDCDHRDLIDQSRDDAALNDSSLERAGADQKISCRFALSAFVQKGDISAHIHADFEDSGTGRVDPYILKKDLTSRGQKSGRDKVSSRRDITRNLDFSSLKDRFWLDGSGRSLGGDVSTEIIQHDLCMVTGKKWLCYAGDPVRIHTGKQNAGFDLCRSNR